MRGLQVIQRKMLRRRTKIICTIGPATDSESSIERLIRSGMNVARRKGVVD